MKRYLGIGVAWLGATILSVVIASTAVAGIRDRVVETPVAIGAPTTTTTIPSATTSTTEVTTTTVAMTSTTAEPPQTTTTVDVSDETTSTTAPPEIEPATTTTTTTTTTVPPAVKYETYSLIGGTVTLAVSDGQVSVATVVPNPGFHADIEKGGPVEVQVEFEGNEHKSELTAKFEGGELKVRTSEEGDDDHHGDD